MKTYKYIQFSLNEGLGSNSFSFCLQVEFWKVEDGFFFLTKVIIKKKIKNELCIIEVYIMVIYDVIFKNIY